MYYTRCSYEGQLTKDEKRMHGRGIFRFANGNTYVGMFHDGAFHGEGIIFFTEDAGGGQYRGVWESGKCINGEYVFGDGLRFEKDGWSHCTPDDRRYWAEYLTFIRPPQTESSDPEGLTQIPDYSVTNGIPPTFAGGQPRGLQDVQSLFWSTAEPPRPEHEFQEKIDYDVPGGAPDSKPMSILIAEANGDVDRDANNPKADRPPVPPPQKLATAVAGVTIAEIPSAHFVPSV